MHIRAAQPGEHRWLSEIARLAKAHWGYGSAELAAWHADLTVGREAMLEWPTVVAELDGAVVGFTQWRLQLPNADLEHLWVLPQAMHRGAGRALLLHAQEHARAAGASTLRIDADPHAEAFYLAHGAHRVGEVSAPIAGQPLRVRPQLVLPLG